MQIIKYIKTHYITGAKSEEKAILKKTLEFDGIKLAIIKTEGLYPFTMIEFGSGESIGRDFKFLKEVEPATIKRLQDFALNQEKWQILKDKISTLTKINLGKPQQIKEKVEKQKGLDCGLAYAIAFAIFENPEQRDFEAQKMIRGEI